VESILGAHARLLREAGHDVKVVAGRGAPDVLVPELDSRHQDVEAVAQALAEGSVDPRFETLAQGLRSTLGEALADREVVVAHNVLTMPFNLPAATALLALGRPLVAWTHDVAWINNLYERYRHDGAPWSLLRDRQPGVTYVAISETRRREIADLFGAEAAEIRMIPNGIDVASLASLGEHTLGLARQAGLLDADPLLLCPQRITLRKRIGLAIDAAAIVAREEPNLKLAISGPLGAHSAENAGYSKRLQKLAAQLGFQDKVIFMHQLQMGAGAHPVADADIAGLFRLADVVVMPSESEGFGLPVLEAGISGTPIVCADIPVLREVSGGDAWLFPPQATAEELAGVIRQALASPNARLRRRARGHDWKRLLPNIEAALEDAVA
jgi:glycosyltransferase involved in cell wall biosynthesis